MEFNLTNNKCYIRAELEKLKVSISNYYSNCISDIPDPNIIEDVRRQLSKPNNIYDTCSDAVRSLIESSLNLRLNNNTYEIINSEISELEKEHLGSYQSDNNINVTSLYSIARQSIKKYVTNLMLQKLKFHTYRSRKIDNYIFRLEIDLLVYLDDELLDLLAHYKHELLSYPDDDNLLIYCEIELLVYPEAATISKEEIEYIIELIKSSFHKNINLIKDNIDINKLIELYNSDIDNYYDCFANSKYMLEFIPNTYNLACVVKNLTPIQINIDDSEANVNTCHTCSGVVLTISTKQDLKSINKGLGLEVINGGKYDVTYYYGIRVTLEYNLLYFGNGLSKCNYYYDEDYSMIVSNCNWISSSSQNIHNIKLLDSEGIDNIHRSYKVFIIDNIMYMSDFKISSGKLTIFRLEHE